MQLKTLFSEYFNATLFRKNLSRFWPMWGMAAFIGSLFPLAMLLELLRNNYYVNKAVDFAGVYYEVVCYAVPIISLAYAILCAIAVWHYLYNARNVGLMHTLPIRREGLFFTCFLSGMAMMLIPYAVVGGLCVAISVLFGFFDPVSLLVTIAAVLCESFFYFSTATLAAFVTGSIFALPAVYFLMHFLAVLMEWLVSTFSQGFIFGLSGGYSGKVNFLSPTVYLIEKVQTRREYEEIVVSGVLGYGNTHTERVLTAVHLENFWVILVYTLIGVVLLAGAWALYRRRSSETAGDVISVGFLRPVFRYGIAALAALTGGLVLYEVFWRNFQVGRYYDAVPMVVCMFIAGTIGYYAASMLLAKSVRIFRSTWKGLGMVLVGCAVICTVLHFDIFGISQRVPTTAQAEYVMLHLADNSYTFYSETEPERMEQVRQLHKEILSRESELRMRDTDWRNGGYSTQLYGERTNEYIRLEYRLKDGTVMNRRYNVVLTSEGMRQNGTIEQVLNDFVNSEDMKLARLRADNSRYVPSGGSVWFEVGGEGFDLSDREAAAIVEAVGRDAQAGNWGEYSWFHSTQANNYAMGLDIEFRVVGDEHNYNDWIGITVTSKMTHTVNCLKQLGIATDEVLKTRAQLYPEDFGLMADPELQALFDKYGVENAYELYEKYGVVTPATSYIAPEQTYVYYD